MIKKIAFCSMLFALAFAVNVYADDQYTSTPSPTAKAKGNVTLTAKLVDEAMLSKDKMAKVEVMVTGVQLAAEGAHLHYQIDTSPVIVTHEDSLSFAALTPGKHTIKVTVVDATHKPLAGPQTVEFTIG